MMSISENFLALLSKYNKSYNNEYYVNFDPLWYHPEDLKDSSLLIKEFIEQELSHLFPDDRTKLILLSPDNIKSDYGIIPITVTVANMIGCRIAVWKEFASMKWGKSSIIGPDIPELDCVVLQHVVRHGTTAVRVAHAIVEKNWKFIAYVAVVVNPVDGLDVVHESLNKVEEICQARPNFSFISSAHDL